MLTALRISDIRLHGCWR